MTDAPLDAIGLGNAIVDVIAKLGEAALAANHIAKGTMTLIDEFRARQLGELARDAEISPGGSAANTIAGLASLGASCGFVGRVKRDALGEAFVADLQRLGVAYGTKMAEDGPATGRSLIFVTPDAQRSMSTYLGASIELSPADIDEGKIGAAGILYCEGYLWDRPEPKAAMRKAMAAAKAHGRKVAFTLSDPFCVGRWRSEFIALLESDVDILFANEHEIVALYETKDFAEALAQTKSWGKIAALTRSEKGSVAVRGDETHTIGIEPAKVVDTTGAGDLYASGFFFGLTRGRDLGLCGRMGAVAAAEVIGHVGPRPKRPLKELFRGKGLI